MTLYITILTDLIAPVLSNLSPSTVLCGEPYDPETIGKPQIDDNYDSQPEAYFEDINLSECRLRRLWTATDSGGNSATLDQVGIYFVFYYLSVTMFM